MGTALTILAVVVVLGLLASLILYWKMKRYLARSGKGVQSTISEIGEEIESYHEKTQ